VYVTVLDGETAVLNCSAKGDQVKYVWFTKPNRELVQDTIEDRIQILPNGPLVFHIVRKEDEGYYQCSVKVDDAKVTKTTNTHWAYLRVEGT
jgi:hypothetical protein